MEMEQNQTPEQALDAAMRGTDEALEEADQAISEAEETLSEEQQEAEADKLIDEVVAEDAKVEEEVTA